MYVSVVIPCYNEEKWIKETVESVLKQDYQDFEVILVNNASTDKTSEIISSLESEYPGKIKTVSEPNKGVSFAREAGRRASKGQIIAQLDADCIVPKNWMRNATALFDSPTIAAVAGTIDYYDGEWRLRVGTKISGMFLGTFNYFLNRFKKRNICWGANIFMRASALEKIGGYRNGSEFYGEEHDTTSRLLNEGTIRYSGSFEIKTSARRFNNAPNPWEIMRRYNKANASVFKKEIEIGTETFHPR
ncbi:MAG: hypothetical protein JWM20_190 [Patescibacteria group bacterium]|nr:hypothetical protein [Patescibacteria group bacterium]